MARELAQIIGNDGNTYELRDKKLADASVVTSIPSGSSVVLVDSGGGVSKINSDTFKSLVGAGSFPEGGVKSLFKIGAFSKYFAIVDISKFNKIIINGVVDRDTKYPTLEFICLHSTFTETGTGETIKGNNVFGSASTTYYDNSASSTSNRAFYYYKHDIGGGNEDSATKAGTVTATTVGDHIELLKGSHFKLNTDYGICIIRLENGNSSGSSAFKGIFNITNCTEDTLTITAMK